MARKSGKHLKQFWLDIRDCMSFENVITGRIAETGGCRS